MIDKAHSAIIFSLQSGIAGLQDVQTYGCVDELTVPACVVNLASFEAADTPLDGSGKLGVECRWELFLVMSSSTDDVDLELRKFAASVAAFVHGNRFGIGDPAAFLLAEADEFGPDFTGGECWRVEFAQTIYLGESEWTAEGVPPSTVMVGHAPDIGAGNSDKYEEVKP